MRNDISLNDISIAEFYILMYAPNIRFTKMMMLTLKDLSLRDVIDLRIEKFDFRDNRTPDRTQVMIYPYHKYKNGNYKQHELHFIKPLRSGNPMSIYNYLSFVYDNVESEHQYVKRIRLREVSAYFKPFTWSLFKLTPKLNKKGEELRQQLLHQIYRKVDELIDCLKHRPAKAYEMLDQLSAKLYLVNDTKKEEMVNVLMNNNKNILNSPYKEAIYGWFLEWEKLQEYNGYFVKSMALSNYRS